MKEPRARGTNLGCKQRLIGGGLQSAYWLLLEVGVGAGGEGRVQASPVSFTFNASNLIVLVELSKTEKEVGLSSLDLARFFFSPRWSRRRRGGAAWQPRRCRKYDLNPN